MYSSLKNVHFFNLLSIVLNLLPWNIFYIYANRIGWDNDEPFKGDITGIPHF